MDPIWHRKLFTLIKTCAKMQNVNIGYWTLAEFEPFIRKLYPYRVFWYDGAIWELTFKGGKPYKLEIRCGKNNLWKS